LAWIFIDRPYIDAQTDECLQSLGEYLHGTKPILVITTARRPPSPPTVVIPLDNSPHGDIFKAQWGRTKSSLYIPLTKIQVGWEEYGQRLPVCLPEYG
jgi:hypothetical protein